MCFFKKKKYLFTWLCWILDAACRIYFPDKGLNLDPLHWEYRVLATGQLRISLEAFLLIPGFCKSQFSWLLWLLLLPAFPQGIFPKEPSSPAWAPSSHLPMLLVLTIIFLKKNFFKLYFPFNTVLVLPYINMNPPWVYTCYVYFLKREVKWLKENVPKW